MDDGVPIEELDACFHELESLVTLSGSLMEKDPVASLVPLGLVSEFSDDWGSLAHVALRLVAWWDSGLRWSISLRQCSV